MPHSLFPDLLRQEISAYLHFSIPAASGHFLTEEDVREDGYRRLRIQYPSAEGEPVPAFLLLPVGEGPFSAVLVHHQHNGQRYLGKSEVCGLAGDPLQAFGPALARRGLAVLAPDSPCFEDRRANRKGITADPENDDEQHFSEMCYRLLRGDTLMRKVLSDSAQAISLLRAQPQVDPERVGILGHSYGGNTVLFHGALDERIRFGCASGAACTYEYKMAHGYGIEMAEVIPGFPLRYDIQDLAVCFAPRPFLIASASQDAHSQDAERIAAAARRVYAEMGQADLLEHRRYPGGHGLTPERFADIVDWMVKSANRDPHS